MIDLQNFVWFVLAGVVVPTIVLALLRRRHPREGESLRVRQP